VLVVFAGEANEKIFYKLSGFQANKACCSFSAIATVDERRENLSPC
jgi:hypothetical protein